MEDKDKKIEEGIKTVLDGLFEGFQKKAQDEFDRKFPELADYINKYFEKDEIGNIQWRINYERDNLNDGSMKYYKGLKLTNDRKLNTVVHGILDGTFYEALHYVSNGYTDMADKFFHRTYVYLTKNIELPVYEEYKEEEIAEWYNNSKWAQKDFASLEDCLKAYVGKPKISLPQFKTVHDIINWFYQLRELYTTMCKADLNKILEAIGKKKEGNSNE